MSGRERARWLLLPLIATILFAGFVAFDVNGSSLPLLGERSSAGTSTGVIAGQPRPVRSDEWLVTTPLSIQAVEDGFPTDPYVGATETDVAIVVNTGPSKDWIEAFKPQDWGYFLLGASRGVAWHWWFSFLVCVVGAYWLFLQLTRSVYLAVAGAFMVTFSPYTAWWSAPSTALLLGFGALAAFLLIRAFTALGIRRRIGWSLGAGYAAGCLIAVAYPPWIIQTIYVVAALVLGVILDNWRGLRAVLGTVLPAMAVAGMMVVSWYIANRESWQEFLGTGYPGNRASVSGTAAGGIGYLQSAPWNFLVWRLDGQAFEVSNNSEAASSWIAIPLVLVAILIGLIASWRLGRNQDATESAAATQDLRFGFWTFGLVGGVFVLLLAWALIPGLELLERVPLLQRVVPGRTPLGLGFAAAIVLLLAVVVVSRTSKTRDRRVYQYTLLAGGAATVALAGLTVNGLRVGPRAYFPLIMVGAIAAFVGLVVLLYAKRTRAAAAVLLASFSFVVWVGVNPLVKGLGPIPNDPLVVAGREFLAEHPDARFIVLGFRNYAALIRTSGAETVSGDTYYPDKKSMRTLFPGQESIWNNFMYYEWIYDPSASPPQLSRVPNEKTNSKIRFDPCDPKVVKTLGVNGIVSDKPLTDSPCLRLESQVKRGDTNMYLYFIDAPVSVGSPSRPTE